MQHRTPRPLVYAWHRLAAATGRLGGERPRRVAFRALVALVVTLSLGGGAYVVGTLMVGESPSRPAESRGSTALRPDEGSDPTGEVPGPGPRTRDATRPRPSASPTGSPEPPSPTAPAPRAPRSSLGQAAGSPSPEAATPSTSPTHQPGATASAPPEDDTPPETSLSEQFPAVDAALFSFSADEPATFACSLDGAAYAPCAALTRYSDLDPGWHTLAVRATDPAGNVDPSPAVTRWHATDGHSGV